MIGSMVAGDDVIFDLSLVDTSGAAFDLTGWTISVKFDFDTFEVTKTVGSGVTLNAQSGATLGTATVLLSDSDTTAITTLTNAVFSVSLQSPGGLDSTPIIDTLIVRPAP